MRVVASDAGVKNLQDVWFHSDRYINIDEVRRAHDYKEMLETERANLNSAKDRLNRPDMSDEELVLLLVRTLDSDKCPDDALAWRVSNLVGYHALHKLAREKLGSDEAVDKAFDIVSKSTEKRTEAAARDALGDRVVDYVLANPYRFVDYSNPPIEIRHFLKTGQIISFEKWW